MSGDSPTTNERILLKVYTSNLPGHAESVTPGKAPSAHSRWLFFFITIIIVSGQYN